MVHTSRKKELLERISGYIGEFYGEDPHKSPDYARIINDKHFDRLSGLLEEGDILIGGKTNSADKYIAPTVIDNVSWDHKIMQEEIFGPLLPVIEYEDLAQASLHDKPAPQAAFFLFLLNQQGDSGTGFEGNHLWRLHHQ